MGYSRRISKITYNEIVNAEQYNKAYVVKVGRPKRSNRKGGASKVYLSLPEKEQIRFAKSYLTFMEYIEANKHRLQ